MDTLKVHVELDLTQIDQLSKKADDLCELITRAKALAEEIAHAPVEIPISTSRPAQD